MQRMLQIQQDFEKYLSANCFNGNPIGLYAPVNYILRNGGKRLRPTVLLMSCYLFDGKYNQAMPAAFAIEVFHNFTLLHDDIMDEAPLRRGNITVHKKFGLNSGILSGDVMMVQAFDKLLQVTNLSILPELMRIFSKLAIEVCEGQQMDMDFETQSLVQIEAYLKMIELKTSVLVAGAMQMGALLGGASVEDAKSIYQFGRNLGIAFQLQDDLLDTYGDPEKFGKKPGGDISQNKKTFLYLKALELANSADRKLLEQLYSVDGDQVSDKIEQVIGLFNKLDIREHTEAVKEQYQKEALEHLGKIQCSAERKVLLENFAEKLMNREI